jgi:hypothetical protein
MNEKINHCWNRESKKKNPVTFSGFSEQSNGTYIMAKNNTHKKPRRYKWSANELGARRENLWVTSDELEESKTEYKIEKIIKGQNDKYFAIVCSLAGVCAMVALHGLIHSYKGGKSPKKYTRKLRKLNK